MAGLTKRLIDASTPEDGKEIRLWDDDPRGFGIRIKPSGVKTFFVQYRSPVTFKKTRLTIGQYGRLTLDEARSEARKVLGCVEKGEDPADEKRWAKAQSPDHRRRQHDWRGKTAGALGGEEANQAGVFPRPHRSRVPAFLRDPGDQRGAGVLSRHPRCTSSAG